MSEEITLYTPATGFPDLEIKIAYGLARVGIEVGSDIEITLMQGYYRLRLSNTSKEKFNKTFLMLAQRLLSSDRWFDLGVKAKYKSIYPTVDKKGQFKESLKGKDVVELFSSLPKVNFNFDKEKACGHHKIPKFGSTKEDSGQLGGLILLASFHAGKPQIRDNRKKDFNLGLCEICGYLATLGSISFCIAIHLGKRKNRKFVLVLPIPHEVLKIEDLLKLLSLQKVLNNNWLSDLIPLRVFSLGLLAKFPSLCDLVKESNLYFHLFLLSKDNRGDTVVEQTKIVSILNYSDFIDFSSYNSSTIENLLGTWSDENPPKIASLNEITLFLESGKKDVLAKFARLYVQETSSNNFTNLLYPETAKYLLKEVAMINSEIIENPALGSLARTLRYFIRERKYSYADKIRNARDKSRDFEETIAEMFREGELRRVQQEQDRKARKNIENWIHLPKDEEIKEVFRLANKDFDGTKTALVILAFSFPVKTEEKIADNKGGLNP